MRLTGCTHQQVHVSPRQLGERKIELYLRVQSEAAIVHIGSHANNFRSGLASHDDVLANRILVRPVAARQRLIHNHHVGSAGLIGFSKFSSRLQGNAHGLEPRGADGLNDDERTFGQWDFRLAFRQHRRNALGNQRERGGNSAGAHSGKRGDAAQEIVKERDLFLRVGVFHRRQRNVHGENILRIKPRINVQQP